MYVILFCASPIASVRQRVADAALDAGLMETLPALFQGQLTAAGLRGLTARVRAIARGARRCHVEILVLPSGRLLRRTVLHH